MALIPTDAGIGMRMQAAADLLQPIAPIQEVPTDLPELRQGQVFSARIQEVLPENTYKALVAGKQITLQLPEGAKAGDTLELVVIDRTPKVVIAQLAEQSGAAANDPYPYATLSKAGQMIGSLLPKEGEAPAPARLNGGQPVLPQAPSTAGELAPALAKAVTSSGLFYEAHLVQWAMGQMPTAQLLQEPQGMRSAPMAFLEANQQPGDTEGGEMIRRSILPERTDQGATKTANNPAGLLRNFFGAEEAASTQSSASTAAAANTAHAKVPEELRPLVQQQLDAAASQRVVWHGEAWPNQPIKWEVAWEEKRQTADGAEEPAAWRTSLSMDSPRLGRVDAALQLTPAGVRIVLVSPYGPTAANLSEGAPALAASLEAAGVPLIGFQVRHESEEQSA